MWREFNYKILKYINYNYNGTIIAPMTIYVKQYYDEIIGRLVNDGVLVRHFILSATKQTIINRLIGRGNNENDWAAQHIDICLNAFETDISEIKIDTENKSVDEIACEIKEKL
jgi:broad-specificity NMP kinase